MTSFTTWIAAALLAPSLALASGTAVLQGGKDRYTLEYQDDTRMRLASDRQSIYLIARDGQVYAVTQMAGRPMVMAGSSMLQLLSSANGGFATGNDDIKTFGSLTPTKRVEMVAGIRGTVYTLTYTDRAGQQRTEEAVLTSDARVAGLTRSVGKLAADLQRGAGVDNQGAQQLVSELDKRRLGALRVGSHYQLVSLDDGPVADERVALPSAPVQLPEGLGGLLQGIGKRP